MTESEARALFVNTAKSYLGYSEASGAETVELAPVHPVFCYRNGGIQLWTGVQLELDALSARISALEGA